MSTPLSDPFYEAIDKIAKGAETLRGGEATHCDRATQLAYEIWKDTETRKQYVPGSFIAFAPSQLCHTFNTYGK